ncbi:MAG TPA: hypothetical protein DDY17_03570 [Syntrophaceae bacterium]|jgi:hypothetical protein|nr:hypothetical protein [Syntrophaceae bacterium]
MNTEKLPSQEGKKRKNRSSLYRLGGGFCALVLVIIAVFFWQTIPDDAINFMGRIYPSKINKPVGKSVLVPPLEDTHLKGQTEILSLIAASNRKKYSIQIRAYREQDIIAATEFVTTLKKRAPDVHMEKVYIQGQGVWNRILVGHFATFEEASLYMKEKKIFDEYPGSFVKLISEE